MPPRTSLPEPVEQAISSWLERHDRLAPGMIEGLHLVGSAALDDACFELNPVTWHTLAARGRAVRGPDPADLSVATTTEELTDFVRANVDGYWRLVAETVETADATATYLHDVIELVTRD